VTSEVRVHHVVAATFTPANPQALQGPVLVKAVYEAGGARDPYDYGAPYGVNQGGVKSDLAADVTERLNDLSRGRVVRIKVNNATLGGDPAPGRLKQLRLTYQRAGETSERIVPKNGSVQIGVSPVPDEPPAFEFAAAADGTLDVFTSVPGVAEVKTRAGDVLKGQVRAVPVPLAVDGAWTLSFPPDRGAPPRITLPKLVSWTDSEDSGVRYFSGSATYRKEVQIPAERFGPDTQLWLDLGEVKNFAEISVNGRPLGVLWKPPFRADITAFARPGANQLEIKVTKLWPNRLIGDEQLPPDCEWSEKGALKQWPQWLLDGKPSPTGRVAFATWHFWIKDDQPLPPAFSGR
jgi:hypothetical protein